MGLALDGSCLALGTRNTVWKLRNVPDIAPQLEPRGTHDACFVPRSCHVTGDIRGHELAFGLVPGYDAPPGGGRDRRRDLWMVNTRFSCLCTIDPDYSFVPRWKPPFITDLTAEDRCHLNGLAAVEGEPKYVTALGQSDTQEGWRTHKANGGILMDVPSGEIVCRGLSMPHSPRVDANKLWILNSGEGELQEVDLPTGKRNTAARLPGYTRGLSFHSLYAFVGLSKIREKKEFGGLPIEDRHDDLKCGIWVVDLHSGDVAGFMAFESGCEEIFGVEVLPGVRWPAIIGFKKDTIDDVFVVPPQMKPDPL